MTYTLEELENIEKDAEYKNFEVWRVLHIAELILEVAKEGYIDGDITDKTLGIVSAHVKAIKAVSAYAEAKYQEAREASFKGLIDENKNNDK